MEKYKTIGNLKISKDQTLGKPTIEYFHIHGISILNISTKHKNQRNNNSCEKK